MNESQPRAASNAFERQLMSALARLPVGSVPPRRDDDGAARAPTREADRAWAAPPPIGEHRRDLLFGLSASALAVDGDEDLSALVRERLAAAFSVGRVARLWEIAPRELAAWVREELFFSLPLEPDQWRRFMLSVGESLALAERTGEIVPENGWTAIRVRARQPVDPTVDTIDNMGIANDTAADARATAAEEADELRALPDPRIAEYFLIHTCCGQTAEELADGYDVAPQEIAEALAAARTWRAKSRPAAAPAGSRG